MFSKLDAHSMNWPRHVMSHGKLQLFPNLFFFFSINIDCCLRVSPEGLNLCESRCGNTSRAPGESTWKSSAAHWRARPDLTRWPSLFKQLVLLRWEQPPESLAGFRFLFLSPSPPPIRRCYVTWTFELLEGWISLVLAKPESRNWTERAEGWKFPHL